MDGSQDADAGMPADFRPSSNVNASAPPGADPSVAGAVQSETSMVRIDRDGGSRLMIAYNDYTTNIEGRDGGSFEFVGDRSVMGWSTSAGDVLSWTRHSQLAFPTDGGMSPLGGDPRLAVFGRHVLYVGMSYSAPFSNLSNLDGVVLGRYNDVTQVFEPLVQVAKGNESDKADGPSIAITRDGSRAMVTWVARGNQLGHSFKILSNLQGPQIDLSSSTEELGGISGTQYFPSPNCVGGHGSAHHPVVSAGDDVFYLAVVRNFLCKKDTPGAMAFGKELLEFWRIDPAQQGAARTVVLNVQELPAAGSDYDDEMNGTAYKMRGQIVSMVAAKRNNDEEVLIGAFPQKLTTKLKDGEGSRQEIMLVRVTNARKFPKGGGGITLPVEADRAPQAWTPTMDPRRGYYEFQPILFSGGTERSRVGLAYYVQPFNGLKPGMQPQDIRSTFVEAVVSLDAGETFSRPFWVTAPVMNEPTNSAGGFPQLFFPCPSPAKYAGDYISGVFQHADPMSQSVTVAWTDSRKGCADQGNLATLTHQHVYVGSGQP